MSLSSVHISYILAGISDGEPWYYGRIPIRTWVELPSSYPRRKSGQIFILRKNESGHDRPISDLASKLDVRGPVRLRHNLLSRFILLHHYPPIILQQQTQSEMLSGPYRICGSSVDSHSIENRVYGRSLTRTPKNSITLVPIVCPDQRRPPHFLNVPTVFSCTRRK